MVEENWVGGQEKAIDALVLMVIAVDGPGTGHPPLKADRATRTKRG